MAKTYELHFTNIGPDGDEKPMVMKYSSRKEAFAGADALRPFINSAKDIRVLLQLEPKATDDE